VTGKKTECLRFTGTESSMPPKITPLSRRR
jgi:hypothetical protein